MNPKTQNVMFSSKSNEWETPKDFFEKLNWRFGPFTLDPCASEDSAKCTKYYTVNDDGLSKNWDNNTVFVNPPYGREINSWIKKAFDESKNENTTVVMLIPARTDTRYWHDYVMKAKEVHFVKGRLKFGDSSNSAPFPSAVVVFSDTADSGSSHNNSPRTYTMSR
jgi:phage N-6-adenine-methyltransferase